LGKIDPKNLRSGPLNMPEVQVEKIDLFFLSGFAYLVVPLVLQRIQYSVINRKSPISPLSYDYYTYHEQAGCILLAES